ncbi:MAG: ATP-dependent DNA helicase RecQ [Bacteroidota bacterium]|nr:ATP-dependent DNA helicase RecQ [Bacteroidota bacterium]
MTLKEALKKHFGFDSFLKGQEEVISKIIEGKSSIAIFPTGSGKSICYQLPALLLPHLTLVISPLLALMQDQIEFLNSHGIEAARIDSTLSREEEKTMMEKLRKGEYKILMISVERFKNERFRAFLKQISISLIVVDEAHCISEWGHNFRPDYIKLPLYQQEFSIPQVLLLTATATPKVIKDMADKFRIHSDDVVVTGFYRPNLHLKVQPVAERDKYTRLLEILKNKEDDATIVYATLQKTTEQIAGYLSQNGFKAAAYHAGMSSEQRESIQNDFMTGKKSCIIATIAFGMGIDKSNIRNVIHFDLPKSIENYSQEIGRAGRDGNTADCILLGNRDNVNVLENFIYGDTPDPEGIKSVLQEIKVAGHHWEVVISSLSSATNIRLLPLKTLLVYLEIKGIIQPLYSYFANYRFSNIISNEQILQKLKGERKDFIKAIFDGSDKARKWTTVNFNSINALYPCNRDRITAALEYFNEKGYIELEAKETTDLFVVKKPDFDLDSLASDLYTSFKEKEKIEVQRIAEMISFFEGETCLSYRLAEYFGETIESSSCEECSVCLDGPTKLPISTQLSPLSSFSFSSLTNELFEIIPDINSPEIITRFLCGISTPIFSRKKIKTLNHFGILEHYPYQDVYRMVQNEISKSLFPYS